MSKPAQSAKDTKTQIEQSSDPAGEAVEAKDIVRRGLKKILKESNKTDDEIEQQFNDIRSRPNGIRKRFRL